MINFNSLQAFGGLILFALLAFYVPACLYNDNANTLYLLSFFVGYFFTILIKCLCTAALAAGLSRNKTPFLLALNLSIFAITIHQLISDLLVMFFPETFPAP